jgi:hypothetical protein
LPRPIGSVLGDPTAGARLVMAITKCLILPDLEAALAEAKGKKRRRT